MQLIMAIIFCIIGIIVVTIKIDENFTDFIKSADDMWKQSVWPSLISAQLASRHLKDGGLLTLPGAQPGTSATPGLLSPDQLMLPYFFPSTAV